MKIYPCCVVYREIEYTAGGFNFKLNRKKLKKLKQLEKVRALYDCNVKCLVAVSFIVANNISDAEQIKSLFDCSKTCSNSSIREFICEVVPGINNCCVCADLENKIETLSVLVKIEN